VFGSLWFSLNHLLQGSFREKKLITFVWSVWWPADVTKSGVGISLNKSVSVLMFFSTPIWNFTFFEKGSAMNSCDSPLSGVDSYTQHGEWLGGMFEPTPKQTYPRLPSLPNVRYGMCFFSSPPKTLAFWQTKPQQLMTWKNYGIPTAHISSRGFSNVCLFVFFRSFQWSPVTKTGWWFQICFIHTLIWSGENSHFD